MTDFNELLIQITSKVMSKYPNAFLLECYGEMHKDENALFNGFVEPTSCSFIFGTMDNTTIRVTISNLQEIIIDQFPMPWYNCKPMTSYISYKLKDAIKLVMTKTKPNQIENFVILKHDINKNEPQYIFRTKESDINIAVHSLTIS